MTTEIEIYIPRPNSIPWRMLTYLLENPAAQLTRKDIVERFGGTEGGVDATLQKPLARDCLKTTRNSRNQVVWQLGFVKNFRLDPYVPPTDGCMDPVPLEPVNKTAKWSPTAPAPQVPSSPQPKRAAAVAAPAATQIATDTGNPASASAPVEQQLKSSIHAGSELKGSVSSTRSKSEKQAKFDELAAKVWGKSSLADEGYCDGQRIVNVSTRELLDGMDMAAPHGRITPEQLLALQTDPRTACDSRAEFHQHFGWMTLAMEVLAESRAASSPSGKHA